MKFGTDLTRLIKLANSGVDKEIKEMGFKNNKNFFKETGTNVNEIYGAWIPRSNYLKHPEEVLREGYMEEMISPVFTLSNNIVYLKSIPGYVKGKIAYVDEEKLF